MRRYLSRSSAANQRICLAADDPSCFVEIFATHAEIFVSNCRVMRITAPVALGFAENFGKNPNIGFILVSNDNVLLKHKEGVMSMSRCAAEKIVEAFVHRFG